MKHHRRPFAGHRIITSISLTSLLAAFLLLLLVAISLPILKPVYLIVLKSLATGGPQTSTAIELRFGVWGVCASSALDPPTLLTNDGACYGPQLGYEVPEYLSNFIGVSRETVQTIQKGLLIVLVLHPITAGLSFLSLITSLFLASYAFAVITLLMTVVTAIAGSVVLAIDIALVLITRNKLESFTELSLAVEFGNGMWMMVAAVALLWLAVVFLSARVCHCCGVRRQHDHGYRY